MNKTIPISAFLTLASLASAQNPAPNNVDVDLSKRAIEAPIKHGNWTPLRSTRRVAPGLVTWHADTETAKRAAKKSGKPVLVFQLLGDLDQEFC